MALSYQLDGIENWKVVTRNTEQTEMNPITHNLIWASLFLGFNEITKANYKVIFKRMFLWEKVFGALCYESVDEKIVPRYTTLADIKAHIGMWTNSSKMTDAAFNKAFLNRCGDEANSEVRRQENKDGN